MPFLFMPTVLRYLSQGRFFRMVFALFLRVIALFCLIGFLALGAGILSAVGSNSGAVTFGGVVFFLCLLIGAYMVVHTILLRASDMNRLPDSDFTVFSVLSLFLKLLGEVLACFYITQGIGGGLLFLFAGTSVPYNLRSNIPLANSLPFVESGGFLGGMTFILAGILIGFLALTLGYLLSEALLAFIDIATNLRIIRQVSTGVPVRPDGLSGAPPAYSMPGDPIAPMTQVVPAPSVTHCRQCGNPLQPGSAFCERCGARVS